MMLSIDAPLSERHLEVLRLMAEGFTNRQIAERLVIGEETVATHIGEIIKRLSARNGKHAIALGFRRRLIR